MPDQQPLSQREQEVLAAIRKGLTSKEIGAALGISPRTVDVHRARILAKCGARNTLALVLRMNDAARAEQT